MSSGQEPLIINNFDQGIADSPHKGFGLIRNADIESFPGAVKVKLEPLTLFHSIDTVTFTADAGTDTCTASGSIEATGANFSGAAVYFTTTGTLPAGLSTATIYFLYKVSSSTFKVAASYKNSVGSAAGTQIDITDTGSGVHTMNQVPIGQVNHIVKDSVTYLLTSNGRVWFVPSSTRAYLLHNSAIDTGVASVTNASGQGLVISRFSSTTQKFLFVFRNQLIDSIDVFDDTAREALAWQNGWANDMNSTAGSGNSHFAIEGQDAAIYYCDGRYIGSIIEKADQIFVNTDANTYTHNTQALDLPPREIAQCLEENGTDLLIGGNTFNKIYPWNRISDSFGIPISVPEYGIKQMKNIGGTIYILAGTWGNVYLTQGSYVKHFKKIPTYLINNGGIISSSTVTWGGIVAINGSLVFGVGTLTSGNSGVYRLWPDGRLVIDNVPSTGSANATAIYAEDEFYIMGYNGGADAFINSVGYSSLETVIQSAYYKVATNIEKATYSHLEVVLGRPAGIGQIKISYRDNLSGSFTEIDTYSLDTTNTFFSTSDIGLIDIANIQIQAELDDGGSGQDVELLEIRLLP